VDIAGPPVGYPVFMKYSALNRCDRNFSVKKSCSWRMKMRTPHRENRDNMDAQYLKEFP
jgi:hypothetical protein